MEGSQDTGGFPPDDWVEDLLESTKDIDMENAEENKAAFFNEVVDTKFLMGPLQVHWRQECGLRKELTFKQLGNCIDLNKEKTTQG